MRVDQVRVRVKPNLSFFFRQLILTPKDFEIITKLGLRIVDPSAPKVVKILEKRIQINLPQTVNEEPLINISLIKEILEATSSQDLEVHGHERAPEELFENLSEDPFRSKIFIRRLVHPEDVEAVLDNI